LSTDPHLQLRALIQDGAPDRWLRFVEPVAVVQVRAVAEVAAAVGEVARRVEAEGLWAAGWIAYEAGPGLDRALAARAPEADGPPLVWFALFRGVEAVAGTSAEVLGEGGGGYRLGRWRASITRAAHRRGVAAIRRLIARGDTYQVNFTHRLTAPFAGDPAALFSDLARAQRGSYGAYLDAGRFAICSATPELFFALDGTRLEMRPMKGTARRGLTAADDRERARRLAASDKERAENLMIADMVRNDLGRVARPGTVAASDLFAVERYPTVLQMTSTVTAESDAPVAELVAALFPCASITGAPKASTSRIIARLEDGPRGVYTGAVGWLGPGRRARFGVAIRTAVVDRTSGVAVYGVGGGIVWDSRPAREWRECRLKARVLDESLTRPWPERFELLETLRWEPGGRRGFALLDEHLERLAGSAEYFGFAFDRGVAVSALEAAVASIREAERGGPLRLRLTVDREGRARVEATPLGRDEGCDSLRALPSFAIPPGPARRDPVVPTDPPPLRVALTAAPIDPADPFLYHKTTHRARYEAARAERPEADEVLLWNPSGETTEGTIHNLVVRRRGELVTPPVECGLLPGTLRARLLAEGRVREARVAVAELAGCDEIWLINSVRGWRRAELAGEGACVRTVRA
jgi:para-aminobenzoate synthetase/4-amino-4-deoxychorismate lyase